MFNKFNPHLMRLTGALFLDKSRVKFLIRRCIVFDGVLNPIINFITLKRPVELFHTRKKCQFHWGASKEKWIKIHFSLDAPSKLFSDCDHWS